MANRYMKYEKIKSFRLPIEMNKEVELELDGNYEYIQAGIVTAIGYTTVALYINETDGDDDYILLNSTKDSIGLSEIRIDRVRLKLLQNEFGTNKAEVEVLLMR